MFDLEDYLTSTVKKKCINEFLNIIPRILIHLNRNLDHKVLLFFNQKREIQRLNFLQSVLRQDFRIYLIY